MRTKGGIPPDLDWEAHHLETEQSLFWTKGNVIVQVWMDKDLEETCCQYSKFMKDVDRTDKYLSCYSVMRNFQMAECIC